MGHPTSGQGRWRFDDEHHPLCGVRYCEKDFCRKHRRVYWVCQDFYEERAVGWFGGDGECVVCKDEERLARAARKMGLYKLNEH